MTEPPRNRSRSRERSDEPEGADLEGLIVEILLDFYAEPRDQGESISYITEVFHTKTEKSPCKKT